MHLVDVSTETYGKYQYCTTRGDLWYADSDFSAGGGCGSLKRGAVPSPWQDTPELCAKAKAMRDPPLPKPTLKPTFFRRPFSRFTPPAPTGRDGDREDG